MSPTRILAGDPIVWRLVVAQDRKSPDHGVFRRILADILGTASTKFGFSLKFVNYFLKYRKLLENNSLG